MSARRRITAAEAREDPYAPWNEYVDLLAMSDLEQLEPRQRPAYLVFWYMSEVENGGHFQYFENRGLNLVPETVTALSSFGAAGLAETLSKAFDVASGREWGAIATADQFVGKALEGTFTELDEAFYAATPSAADLLKQHLREHQDWFVEVDASGP